MVVNVDVVSIAKEEKSNEQNEIKQYRDLLREQEQDLSSWHKVPIFAMIHD